MPLIKSTDIVFITGKRGSGKSTFLTWLLRNIKYRWVLWDENFEHGNIKAKYKPIVTRKLLDVVNYYNQGYPYIVYQPVQKTPEKFDLFCKTVFRFSNIVIVIEEIERYATSWFIPKNLKRIIDVGRHKGLGLICTARRTMRTNADIPFNANHIIIFKQTRPQDLTYLSDFVGTEIYGIVKLPNFYFMWWRDDGTLKLYKPV